MSAKIFLRPSLNICLTFSNIWRALTKQLIRSMTKVRWCSWLLRECFTNIQNTKTLRGCSEIIPGISRLLEKMIMIFEKNKTLLLLKKIYLYDEWTCFFIKCPLQWGEPLEKREKCFVCVCIGGQEGRVVASIMSLNFEYYSQFLKQKLGTAIVTKMALPHVIFFTIRLEN